MNRRQFLTGVASLVAAPILPAPPVEDWLDECSMFPIVEESLQRLSMLPPMTTTLIDPRIMKILFRAPADMVNVAGLYIEEESECL